MAESDIRPIRERRPVVWTSFCPELGMYYYRNEQDMSVDPIVWKFTHDELLAHVEGLFQAGKSELSKELVVVCAWARSFAHLVVVLYTDGTFEARKPPPLPAEVVEDTAEMAEYVAKWKEQHPDSSSVSEAPGYGRPDPSTGV
jgi:hypothetical protein